MTAKRAQNTIKKFPGCRIVFCKDLLDICDTFEGSEIVERIRLLDSTVFSERNFSDFLRNTSDKKRIGKDNEEASSSSENRIRLEEINVPSEPFKDHEDEEVYDYDDEISDVKAMNFSIEESETEEISQPEAVQVESSLFNACHDFKFLNFNFMSTLIERKFKDQLYTKTNPSLVSSSSLFHVR
ncbi:hypothetical protein RhiirA5_406214 [Rhizophagus irregularis]|uniref:Uncharacterized protein n=1 Tax=Rhizophagus irregularis TaxID=588596 RepID=A0A2N0QDN5_9GLOM|nr:hypothetical protein RhiirA5_406214 [Rhizophagus irregularis]